MCCILEIWRVKEIFNQSPRWKIEMWKWGHPCPVSPSQWRGIENILYKIVKRRLLSFKIKEASFWLTMCSSPADGSFRVARLCCYLLPFRRWISACGRQHADGGGSSVPFTTANCFSSPAFTSTLLVTLSCSYFINTTTLSSLRQTAPSLLFLFFSVRTLS